MQPLETAQVKHEHYADLRHPLSLLPMKKAAAPVCQWKGTDCCWGQYPLP